MSVGEFKTPLGLFLQGGGALGAWQAAVLDELTAQGLLFDAVMGFSIGAVNGTAIAFDRLPEAMGLWRGLGADVMRLEPRLRPLSLFSTAPLRAFYAAVLDENQAKASLRAEFTVISACRADDAPVNARFTPGGGEWDGPLVDHAAASCAIPLVFPPVDLQYRGRTRRLIDGGVPMRAPLDLAPLTRCADILVVEMVGAAEVGRRWWTPWRALDQRCREAARRLVDAGLEPLLRASKPPRVHRLAPSRPLEPMMLDFRAAGIARMLAQGTADAKAFLAAPEMFRVH